jgi:SAM-dependent methyltransferase
MSFNVFSPKNLKGSFTDDLIASKLWLIRETSKIHKDFKTIYILGSWYGNMSIFLFKKHNIKFDKIINVDINKSKLKTGQELADKLGIADKIEPMVKDANTLDYRQAVSPSLVINTSCNDMENAGWFDNIPKGTLVALQTRDETLDEYDFSKVLYQGDRKLKDPETAYTRHMVIGIK